ncbi:MAG: hypothetical protein IKS18_05880 [Lachnospiraceae bacterium]|nr:hypothetical protein [Lachnospiraceae bacterium]
MDKRTRVLNAMNKLPVDHVPCGFWFHFSGREAHGEECVQAHLRYYRETDLDFLKVMCDGFFSYPLSQDVKTAEDWWKLTPLGKDHPYIKDQVWRAKRIVEEIGQERCVFYNVFAPFSSIRFATDDDFVMESLRENPNAVLHALDVIAQDHALLSELLIREAGCDGIYFPVQGGEWNRFTPEEYHKYVSPSELYVLEHANRFSRNNILHCCGWAGDKNNLTLWKDYPVKVVNWAVHVEEVSLEEGRVLFGNKASLGGFKTLWDEKHEEGILYHGTKEELQQYTKDLILDHGKIGLMLGGDCTISTKLPWERLKWVVEAARNI